MKKIEMEGRYGWVTATSVKVDGSDQDALDRWVESVPVGKLGITDYRLGTATWCADEHPERCLAEANSVCGDGEVTLWHVKNNEWPADAVGLDWGGSTACRQTLVCVDNYSLDEYDALDVGRVLTTPPAKRCDDCDVCGADVCGWER